MSEFYVYSSISISQPYWWDITYIYILCVIIISKFEVRVVAIRFLVEAVERCASL